MDLDSHVSPSLSNLHTDQIQMFTDELGDTAQIEHNEESLVTQMMADFLNDLGD